MSSTKDLIAALKAELKAAGITDALVVSVDGGCAGVASVKDGTIGATAQQYPLKMATLGMEAIASIARGGRAGCTQAPASRARARRGAPHAPVPAPR